MKRILTATIVVLGTVASWSSVYADPLHDAVKASDTASVERLLSEGADINAPDKFGSPLHWAILKRNTALAQLLIDRGASTETSTDALGAPIHAATQRGLNEQVVFLINNGANVDARDKDEKTPLHYAAFYGKASIADLLLKNGADLNARGTSSHGATWGEGEFTALHVAIYREKSDVVKLLAAAGAEPILHPVPASGTTPGDAARGREIAKRCRECHVYETDQPEPGNSYAGPTLLGIVGREIGSVPDFQYSQALKQMSGNWSEELLFSYIRHPMLTTPGTQMVFERLDDAQHILDLIAFLEAQNP